MSDFGVTKYKCKEEFVILGNLFLNGDEVFIQDYDPVGGRPQQVFKADKTLLGKISHKDYWELVKKSIKEEQ